eukprot:38020-Eustigmatos_ZCMA.PRE.1
MPMTPFSPACGPIAPPPLCPRCVLDTSPGQAERQKMYDWVRTRRHDIHRVCLGGCVGFGRSTAWSRG